MERLGMRRGSIGSKRTLIGPAPEAVEEVVVLRNKNQPIIGPGFMRRSCTFVTEGSWRKSSFGIGSGQKETKDRLNLALQVRKKAAQLSECDEDQFDGDNVQIRPGRVSRFVGNLRSWSSSEDVRQSVVGALTRTVNVIKQRPVSKKVRQALSKTTPIVAKPDPLPLNNSKLSHKNIKSVPVNGPILKNPPVKTKAPRGKLNPNSKPEEAPQKGKPLQTPSSASNSKHVYTRGGGGGGVSNQKDQRWLRHLHEAQASYNAREGRNRRPLPPPHLPDADDTSTASDQLRDVEDDADGENSESIDAGSECLPPQVKEDALETDFNASSSTISPSPVPQTPSSPESIAKKTESGLVMCSSIGGGVGAPQTLPGCQSSQNAPQGRSRRLQEVQIIQIVEGPSLIQPSEVKVSQGVVLSAEPVLTPIELLRRKDLKIQQELEEKQNLIADILNIPRQHFESVADMAGEVGLGNKEPRELVLGAIYQAKKFQEALNEAQTVRESDVIAAQACTDPTTRGSTLPLYQVHMEKLLTISGTLTQLLNSLMGLVSERDDERDRMRKELVASRERVHQLHMQQNLVDITQAEPSPEGLVVNVLTVSSSVTTTTTASVDPTSPHSSRPNSFVSIGSSVAGQSDITEQQNTDEDGKCEDGTNSSIAEVEQVAESCSEKCEEKDQVGSEQPKATTEEEGVKNLPESVPHSPTQEETGST